MLAAPTRRQRAEGRIELDVEAMGNASGVRRLAESGSSRLRLPRVRDGVPEAVLINTAGGVAGGDRFENRFTLGPGARLVVTTAAAEKIYRSDGETATASTRIALAPGACLAWLPQETILFDGARFDRRLDVDLADGASALLFEATVFGRAASRERVASGTYRDRWGVRRDGRPVFAEAIRLEGAIADRLDRPAVAGGDRAMALLAYLAPDAEARLDDARRHLTGSVGDCAASAWRGVLVVRWLAPDIATLRADAAAFMTAFRGRALPRVWHL